MEAAKKKEVAGKKKTAAATKATRTKKNVYEDEKVRSSMLRHERQSLNPKFYYKPYITLLCENPNLK